MKVEVVTTIYCQGAASLADQLWADMRIKVTEEEAAAYLAGFFTSYPKVEAYINSTQNFVKAAGFTTSYTGRRRRFPIMGYANWAGNRVSRQAVNARIQSSSSDLVQRNIIELAKELKALNGRVILTVHDSIGFQVPKGAPNMKDLLDEVIVERTKRLFPWLPVQWKYDVAYGPSYGAAKKDVTNEPSPL